MIILKLATICLVNVILIDLSGIIPSIKSLISKLLTNKQLETTNFRIKPFDCSFCMTFWTCLIYLIVINQFSIYYLLFILLLSFFTGPIKLTLEFLKDLYCKLINTLYDKIIQR